MLHESDLWTVDTAQGKINGFLRSVQKKNFKE